jgi:glycolate oxidase FAD binding subunit
LETHPLPITETKSPADAAGVIDAVRAAFEAEAAVYPIGGATSLDFGLPARRSGIGLSLAGLNRVVDYPARDMTITVEAGLTMSKLADTLAAEKQWLPVDVPEPDRSTIGGVIACAASGPRRFSSGTMRDYVIGISAVDGRGSPFKGGGRVVKNVAGYDFCKLLTGSLGTLGVITQVTLKIRPLPEKSALVSCEIADLSEAEKLLGALVTSSTTPAAVELVAGPAWGTNGRLIVGVEGTEPEVAWMCRTLSEEWNTLGIREVQTALADKATELWKRLREFPADRNAPLVLKATVRPSEVVRYMALVQSIDAQASIQAHAATGVIHVRFAEFGSADISRRLIGQLQPAARLAGGHCIVLSSDGLGELQRQAQWGTVDPATRWMVNVKQQFDPKGILNPGRFVYENL